MSAFRYRSRVPENSEWTQYDNPTFTGDGGTNGGKQPYYNSYHEETPRVTFGKERKCCRCCGWGGIIGACCFMFLLYAAIIIGLCVWYLYYIPMMDRRVLAETATMKGSMKIIGGPYSTYQTDLAVQGTDLYTMHSTIFTIVMDKEVRSNAGIPSVDIYNTTLVDSFSNGSIVVDFTMYFMKPIIVYNDTADKMAEVLRGKVTSAGVFGSVYVVDPDSIVIFTPVHHNMGVTTTTSLPEIVIPSDKCYPIPLDLPINCSKYYNETYYPNLLGQNTLSSITSSLKELSFILQQNCDINAELFICAVYVPKCVSEIIILPSISVSSNFGASTWSGMTSSSLTNGSSSMSQTSSQSGGSATTSGTSGSSSMSQTSSQSSGSATTSGTILSSSMSQTSSQSSGSATSSGTIESSSMSQTSSQSGGSATSSGSSSSESAQQTVANFSLSDSSTQSGVIATSSVSSSAVSSSSMLNASTVSATTNSAISSASSTIPVSSSASVFSSSETILPSSGTFMISSSSLSATVGSATINNTATTGASSAPIISSTGSYLPTSTYVLSSSASTITQTTRPKLIKPCMNLCSAFRDNCKFLLDWADQNTFAAIQCELMPQFNTSDIGSCVGGQEAALPASTNCPADWFECDNSMRCASRSWICDNIQDCKDNMDESVCGTCPAEKYRCASGQCIDQTRVCDGSVDCYGGSDEKHCINAPNNGTVEVIWRENSQWYQICSTNWSDDATKYICKQMGNVDTGSAAVFTNVSDQNRVLLLLSGYNKSQPLLSQLTLSDPWTGHRCPSGQVVNITCGEPECGIRPAYVPPIMRIIGGSESKPGAWPWLAALLGGKSKTYYCAAFLINRQWVVTAAHCISGLSTRGNYSDITVRLGASRRTAYSVYMQDRTPILWVKHPKYVLMTFPYDIGLIKLDQPVTISDYVRPICLPPADMVMLGRVMYGAAWGKTAEEATEYSPVVNQVSLNVVPISACRSRIGSIAAEYVEQLTEVVFCAGGNLGYDTCGGDSGSALVTESLTDGRWYAAGVTAAGIGCGMAYPAVYTNVPSFLDWIQQVITANT